MVRDTQNLTRSTVVVVVKLGRGVTGSVLWRQLRFQLRVALSNNVRKILVREETIRDEESLSASLCDFNGSDVSQGNIANIDPKEGACGRQFVLKVTLDEVLKPLVGCVDCFERVQVVHNGSEDKGRVDRSDVEVGLFLFNEVPCSLLRKGLYPGQHWVTIA